MSLPSPVSPFEESADPRDYIPRFACEEALRSLLARICDGPPAILLRGPAGIGKSMLLRVLQERLAQDRRITYTSVPPSPAAEISHRILDQLAEPLDDDPPSSLAAAARRSAAVGRPVLVIIDHATAAPIASSLQLARAAAEVSPGLCVLFAVSEEDDADSFERAIGTQADVVAVRFTAAMNEQEASEYITQRLGRTLVSQELRTRLDAAALRWVIDGANGLPRAVNERASELLRRMNSGEDMPVREQDAGQPSGLDARGHAAPPDVWPPRPRPTPSGDATRSDASLGGGLLGIGYRGGPQDLDDTSERFPPGYLGTWDTPPESPGEPAASASASETADEEREARAETEPPVLAEPSDADADAHDNADDAPPSSSMPALEPAAPAVPQATLGTRAPIHAEPADAVSGRSARSKLSVAALVVMAAVVGYLAGRIELGGTESSSRRVETRTSVPQAGPIRPTPVAPQSPLERSDALAANRPTAATPAKPLSESTPLPPGSTSTPEVAKKAAPSAPRSNTMAAKPERRRPVEAEKVPAATAPVAATLALPSASSAAPQVAATPKPKPVPAPEPRTEPTAKASAASTLEAAPASETLAPAELPDDAQTLADSSATAIVVGALGQEHPGARAVAYVRLQVALEPGSILVIDGERIGVAPFSDLIVEPGLHSFVAELPDGIQIEQLIEVTAETGVVEF